MLVTIFNEDGNVFDHDAPLATVIPDPAERAIAERHLRDHRRYWAGGGAAPAFLLMPAEDISRVNRALAEAGIKGGITPDLTDRPAHLTEATPAQMDALRAVWRRELLSWRDPNQRRAGNERAMTYGEFQAFAQYSSLTGCIMVPWLNMWLGIEPDGYTHS